MLPFGLTSAQGELPDFRYLAALHPEGIPYGTESRTASPRVIFMFLILNSSPSIKVKGVSKGGVFILRTEPSGSFTALPGP